MGRAGSRVPSRLSARHTASPLPDDESGLGTPRKASGGTKIDQSRRLFNRSSLQGATTVQPSNEDKAKDTEAGPARPREGLGLQSPTSPASSLSPASSDSETETQPRMMRSQTFRQARQFTNRRQPSKAAGIDEETEEDDDFLPFSNPRAQSRNRASQQDPSATLRLEPNPRPIAARRPTTERVPEQPTKRPQPLARNTDATTASSSSAASSTSSAAPPKAPARNQPQRQTGFHPRPNVPLGPLSPRRTAELAGVSPRRRPATGREGSEGTPSMGSSFSDLDGKSLTYHAKFTYFADSCHCERCKRHTIRPRRGATQ